MFVITLELHDGKNYYCGKEQYGKTGMFFHSWDTDKRYRKVYMYLREAEDDLKIVSVIPANFGCKIEPDQGGLLITR
jgi:hypothetical protein